MRKMYIKQLNKLNNELIIMGNLIEQAIEMAVTALVKKDINLAMRAIEFDTEIDNQERDIESLALKILLKQQPVAKDLRQVSSALKMVTDMERIGDHAADISEITIMTAGQNHINKMETIEQMAKETTIMLVKSIEAFVDQDVKKAQWVINDDDVVDRLFDEVKKELIELIAKDTKNGEQATDLLMVAKYFERIGDHATNIAEWVIFAVTGEH